MKTKKLTPQLKSTLQSSTRFTTLSLCITMLGRCVELMAHYGISPETISFFQVGLDKLNEEIALGYKYVKDIETFNHIVKDVKSEIKSEESGS